MEINLVVNGDNNVFNFVELREEVKAAKEEVNLALEMLSEYEEEIERLEKQIEILKRKNQRLVESEECVSRDREKTGENIRILFSLLTKEQKEKANLLGFNFQIN